MDMLVVACDKSSHARRARQGAEPATSMHAALSKALELSGSPAAFAGPDSEKPATADINAKLKS